MGVWIFIIFINNVIIRLHKKRSIRIHLQSAKIYREEYGRQSKQWKYMNIHLENMSTLRLWTWYSFHIVCIWCLPRLELNSYYSQIIICHRNHRCHSGIDAWWYTRLKPFSTNIHLWSHTYEYMYTWPALGLQLRTPWGLNDDDDHKAHKQKSSQQRKREGERERRDNCEPTEKYLN